MWWRWWCIVGRRLNYTAAAASRLVSRSPSERASAKIKLIKVGRMAGLDELDPPTTQTGTKSSCVWLVESRNDRDSSGLD